MSLNFKEMMEERRERVNRIMETYLPQEKGPTAELAKAINYSMRAPGKRLRPIILLESYAMFGGKSRVAEPFVTALEMIHTHSLIHDDLPALDNDNYRRGQETTWAAFGEALGILSGDVLLNYAYEVALSGFDWPNHQKETVLALQILGYKTGMYGMLGGQSIDVISEGKNLSEDALHYIYKNKTSALIEASFMLGPLLAGAPPEKIITMEQIGTSVGLAFQIQDDILDVTGTQESIGKPVNSDKKNQKTTYVTLKGVDGAKWEAKRLLMEALMLLDDLEEKNEFLRRLIQELANRKK